MCGSRGWPLHPPATQPHPSPCAPLPCLQGDQAKEQAAQEYAEQKGVSLNKSAGGEGSSE